MIGVELDFIVTDSLAALALYESIFEVQRVEVTAYERGMNEAVFTIYGARFHMLDANPDYGMHAPAPNTPQSMWVNIVVPDIHETYGKAMAAGCTELQPIIDMEAMGASNAMFADPFGYTWLLHQINREVSFEERQKIMEELHG